MGTLVLHNTSRKLRIRLHARRNTQRNSTFARQRRYYGNTNLSRHLVGTLTSSINKPFWSKHLPNVVLSCNTDVTIKASNWTHVNIARAFWIRQLRMWFFCTNFVCVPGISSCYHCNFHLQNDAIPTYYWPSIVTSELGHCHMTQFCVDVCVVTKSLNHPNKYVRYILFKAAQQISSKFLKCIIDKFVASSNKSHRPIS